MRLTDGFVDLLRSLTLTVTTYVVAARELTELLQGAAVELGGGRAAEQAFRLRSLAAVDGRLDACTALTRDVAPAPAAR